MPKKTQVESRPYRVLLRHLDAMQQFTALMAREQKSIDGEVRHLESPGVTAPRGLGARVQRFVTASPLMWMWRPVLLVTFAETYLQDVLVEAARFDPSLMEESEQQASYDDVQKARSLRSLSHGLRMRWARNFVDGGPTKLSARFTKMGARSYDPGDIERLEQLWGMRHVVVHRSGFATAEFVARHPSLGATVGRRVAIAAEKYDNMLFALVRFLRTTEAFAVKRWPGLVQRKARENG